jgi:GDP-L-fucose synthase
LDQEAVEAYLEKHRFDAVIHSAGIPVSRKIKNPKNVALGNLGMFFNLVSRARFFSRMICLGSGSEYDQRRDLCGVREEEAGSRIPADELGFSKWICSRVAEREEGVTHLRLFGVFGKYEDYEIRFVSNALCKEVFDLPVTIRQNRFFSYLWVDDLCRIVEYFMTHSGKYKVYNVVPDHKADLLSIARQANRIAGKDLEIRIEMPGLGPEYTGDNSRLREEMKDFRFTPLEEAMETLYRWYQENKNDLRRECLLYDP